MLYRLIELHRGGKDHGDLLKKIDVYYLIVSLLGYESLSGEIERAITDATSRGQLEHADFIRQLAETSDVLHASKKRKRHK